MGLPEPHLDVRPLRPDEAHRVVDYFHAASASDLERMGVDPGRLPPRAGWVRRLTETVRGGPSSGSFYQAWLLDGQPIGHTALKDLVVGEHANIHLHLWDAGQRGRGLGGPLFCRSVLDAYDRFGLRHLVCEPSVANPGPNRLLQALGFPLARTYTGASSELSAVIPLNRYDIPRDVAQRGIRLREPARPLAGDSGERRHEHNPFDKPADMGAQ